MTTRDQEFKSVSEIYREAVGEYGDSCEVNLSNVFGFLVLTVLVLMPFWFEHFLIWYYNL